MRIFTLPVLFFLGFSTLAFADFAKGFDAYTSGDYATALKEFKPLAEQGHLYAQYNLGFMYDNGEGVTQDYKTAVKWYKLAAEQGDSDAQFNLGIMYYIGQGVTQDYKTALKWYKLAAEQGHSSAQSNLGSMYYSGHGVTQDYVRAHMWANIGASNGNEIAVQLRTAAGNTMTSSQLATAQKLASECVAKDYKGC